MAEELVLNVAVNSGEAGKSLKSLRAEFKEISKELDGLTVGSEKYIETLKRLGATKDEIGDLNQTIKAFNPEGRIQAVSGAIGGLASGFQAATAASALMGVESEDLQKTLLKVQAAMAFADGIKGVVGLGDSFKNLGAIMKSTAIGQKIVTAAQWLWNAAVAANPIGAIVVVVAALVAGIYALVSAQDDEIEREKELAGLRNENTKRLNTEHIKALSNQMDLMKARGATADEIFKQELANTNELLELNKEYRKSKAITDEEYFNIQDDLFHKRNILNATNAKRVEDEDKKANDKKIADNKKNADEKKKLDDDAATAKKKLKADDLKDFKDQQDFIAEFVAEQEKADAARLSSAEKLANDLKALKEKSGDDLQNLAIKMLNDLDAIDATRLSASAGLINEDLIANQTAADSKILIAKKYEEDKAKIEKEAAKKAIDLKRAETIASLQIAQSLGAATQSMSDAFFAIKNANVKKGSAAELKAAKDQFKINKALSLANGAIAATLAVMTQMTMLPPPLGIAMAVAAGIAGVANLAKIAGTQFEGGGASVTAPPPNEPPPPPLGDPPATTAPQITAPVNSVTQLNPDGTVASQVIRAYVVESDITRTQQIVRRNETQAVF